MLHLPTDIFCWTKTTPLMFLSAGGYTMISPNEKKRQSIAARKSVLLIIWMK